MRALRGKLRLLLGALFAIALVGGLFMSRFGVETATAWSAAATSWAASAGPAGYVMFAAAQTVVALVGIVPASLLGLAAGGLYGIGIGFVLAAIGTMLGGGIAFLLARSLLRPWVERLLTRRGAGSRLRELDSAVARDGWRFVCLARISPVMPFAITSYALGLTEISLPDYLIGTLAALPALFGYVAVGALAQYGLLTAAGGGTGPLGWLLIGLGIAATALLALRSGTLLSRAGLLSRRRA